MVGGGAAGAVPGAEVDWGAGAEVAAAIFAAAAAFFLASAATAASARFASTCAASIGWMLW